MTLGCLLAILSVSFHRETSPFLVATNNVICVCAQHQILLTLFTAFVVLVGALDSLSSTGIMVGTALFAVNIWAMALAVGWSLARFRDEEERRSWRRGLSAEELEVVNRVMRLQLGAGGSGSGRDSGGSSGGAGGGTGGNDSHIEMTLVDDGKKQKPPLQSLERYLLKPSDVTLGSKLGSGSFGEVFKGKCVGQPVSGGLIEPTDAHQSFIKSHLS